MHKKDMVQMILVIAIILVAFYLVQAFLVPPSPAPVNTPTNVADNRPDSNKSDEPEPDEKEPGEIASTTPSEERETRPTSADPKYGFDRIERDDAAKHKLANSRLTADISERGAVIERLYYIDENGEAVYLRTPDNPIDEPTEPLTLIEPLSGSPFMDTLSLSLDENDSWRNTSRWELVERDEKDRRLTFRFPPAEFGSESDGTVIFKTIRLLPDTYRFDVTIRIENHGAKGAEKIAGLWGPVGMTNDASRAGGEHSRIALYGSTQSKRYVDFEDSPEVRSIRGEVDDHNEDLANEGKETNRWMAARVYDGVDNSDRFLVVHGIRTRYFLAFLAADPDNRDPRWSGRFRAIKDTDQHAATSLLAPPMSIPALKDGKPGSAEVALRFYAGPREKDTLTAAWNANPPKDEEIKVQWAELATSGFFDVIAAPLIWGLGLLTNAVGAGLAVILLTLIIRFSLAPLSYRGQKAMATYSQKMKIVKPKLDAIKEKYAGKSDRDSQLKMLTETREAMKAEDVGMLPLGGCLPMLIQLPVFIGLYRAFGNAFFLRQAEFLWIRDLSLPDATIPVSTYVGGGLIGFLAHNGYLTFNILPMLWIVLSILQFKLQPKPEDPQQASMQKNMAFIFPIMGLFFYGFAAGFSFYFIFSSLYSIGESKLIKHNLRKQGVLPPKDEKKPEVKKDDKPDYHGAS